MDVLKEIQEATAKGIREYLRSTRGANACGPDARVEESRHGLRVIKANGDCIFISFMEA